MIHDKKILFSIADGPESVEIYTSEDEAVVDFAACYPAMYLTATVNGASVKLGPFHLKSIRDYFVSKSNDDKRDISLHR